MENGRNALVLSVRLISTFFLAPLMQRRKETLFLKLRFELTWKEAHDFFLLLRTSAEHILYQTSQENILHTAFS